MNIMDNNLKKVQQREISHKMELYWSKIYQRHQNRIEEELNVEK